MGIQAPAEVKYGLILEAVRQDGNLLNISALCRIADVSRSGYYAWLDAAPLRQSREETDSTDFALVKQAYEFRGYKKGARSIYMRLLHLDPPVVMNIKKIRRLMRKYGLRCPIRQANPYRQMAKAMKTSHVAKNEINAPQESFFGHMKDEIASLVAGCATYEQVQAVVADWMDYYNKDRYQWDLEKLSPREYYCYRQTGVYPLKPGISKKRNSQGSAPDPEV